MATHLTVLSVSPAEPNGLAPTPSVSDWDRILETLSARQVPEITDLMSGPIRILETYRGWNLYCDGGVTVYRTNPKSEGGHGYAGMPIPDTTEEVKISCARGWFKCEVRYGIDRFRSDSIMGDLWKVRFGQLHGATHSQIQNEYECFCRTHLLVPCCWEPYGPYPIHMVAGEN